MDQSQIVELIDTALFKHLVDIRSGQIRDNIMRFCSDPKYRGEWTEEVFTYRPSSWRRDRKDQWNEIVNGANYYLKYNKEFTPYNWEKLSTPFLRHNFEKRKDELTRLGYAFKSLLKSDQHLLKKLLNDAVLQRKSLEEWKDVYKKCEKEKPTMSIQTDYNEGEAQFAAEFGQSRYGYGGRKKHRTHRKHHKKSHHSKTKAAKKGGKSRRHRKTYRKN